MQTFLPYSDFRKSLSCLDNKRLGKQRVEAATILSVLLERKDGWKNHPATKMWEGYENALIEYFNLSVEIWKARGFKNTYEFKDFIEGKTFDDPPWLGDERVHSSHRSNLLRKDKDHYEKFGWTDDPSQPYFWPIQESK